MKIMKVFLLECFAVYSLSMLNLGEIGTGHFHSSISAAADVTTSQIMWAAQSFNGSITNPIPALLHGIAVTATDMVQTPH